MLVGGSGPSAEGALRTGFQCVWLEKWLKEGPLSSVIQDQYTTYLSSYLLSQAPCFYEKFSL